MSESPVAIVTGAGTGIGRETCLLLAELGYRLALVGRRRDKLEATRDDIAAAGFGREVKVVAADLTEPASATAIVSAADDTWGRVDCLVNNAGGVEMVPIEETCDELLRRTFEVNTFSPARLIAVLWPIFRRQRCGCVVNVSSRATADPYPGLAAYAAAKSALESLARSVLTEGRALGIRSYIVAPGAVETPMLRSLWTEDELPPSQAMPPRDVAQVVVDCITGKREKDIGLTIRL